MAEKEDPCWLVRGPIKKYCERGATEDGGGSSTDDSSALGGFMDPLGSAAEWLSDQAAALYRQMDKLMMSGASPLDVGDGSGISGVYNPVAGMSLLIGAIVLLGGLIVWMARPSGHNFRKAGQAGSRFLGLIVLATAAPVLVALIAYGLGQFTTVLYADVADQAFKGMEKSLLGSDSDPWGRLAQAAVAVLSIGPLWLMCKLTPLAVAAGMVFLPLAAAFGVARGWWKSTTLRRLMHLLVAVFLARVPVSIVLMFRPLMPQGALTDLLLTGSVGAVCLYFLLNLPSIAQGIAASVTRMPKVKASTEGRTTVTKMPADRERKVHTKNLSHLHTPGNRPSHRPTAAKKAKPAEHKTPQPAKDTHPTVRPSTMTEERSRRARVPDLPARPPVRDTDTQAPTGRR